MESTLEALTRKYKCIATVDKKSECSSKIMYCQTLKTTSMSFVRRNFVTDAEIKVIPFQNSLKKERTYDTKFWR